MVRLESKVAIVTGGGQGVGRGVALALAREGARVAVVGRTVSKCDRVAHEITERGGHALAFACDVTNRADVERCVGHVHESWGPVEVLVNAAQSLAYASLRRTTEDDMEMLWQSGPMGTFRFMQICFEDLRTTKGLIVNFGSGSGITAPAAMGGYAAVKEAIRTLSRTAAVEWGRHGIRVERDLPTRRVARPRRMEGRLTRGVRSPRPRRRASREDRRPGARHRRRRRVPCDGRRCLHHGHDDHDRRRLHLPTLTRRRDARATSTLPWRPGPG